MSSATSAKENTSQDVEMKDVEKTENTEEIKKDPDILTLEGMLCCFKFSFGFYRFQSDIVWQTSISLPVLNAVWWYCFNMI